MSERHEAYLYHVTFNAMHNLVLDNPRKMHAHTFRVGMYVIEKQEEYPVFLSSEKMLDEYFSQYQGIRLNELEAFRDIVPTLENMGEIFYRDLKPVFAENGMQLLMLELGDSPVSTYAIGEKLLLGNAFNLAAEGAVEKYIKRVRKGYGRPAMGENT